jgi:hypothetical protein
MDRMVYVGPDLIFRFTRKKEDPDGNYYEAHVKAGGLKLSVVVQFEMLQAQVKDKPAGPVECFMKVAVCGIAGPPADLQAVNKAINVLTVNSKLAGEVCCQAFLNNYLDADF